MTICTSSCINFSFVYACPKKGIAPDTEQVSYESPSTAIPAKYWISIMRELARTEYLAGTRIIDKR